MPLHAIGRLVGTDRDGLVRHVREVELERFQLVLDARRAGRRASLISSPTRFIASICADASCLFFFSVAISCDAAFFCAFSASPCGDGAAALGVERDEALEVDGRAAVFQRAPVVVSVFSEVLAGKHGRA